MIVGPASRSLIPPLPDSRSLVPVTPARALPVPVLAPIQPPQEKPSRRPGKTARQDADQTAGASPDATDSAAEPAPTPPRNERAAAALPGGEPARRLGPAVGNAAYVTQVLAQEVLKQGLHIEPWKQAMVAYERAAQALGPGARFPMP